MTGNSLQGVLLYNQQKVDKEKGSVLATNILCEPADGRFSVAATVADFRCFMPERFRCENPVLHISINPDPKDRLENWQLAEIAGKYMERMGWGDQPYMVFKHTDIERTHIHIVSVQVDSTGKKINDKMRNQRSWKIVQALEKEYGLHPAQEQKNSELWQLTPVDHAKGDLKKQIGSVVKPAVSMYRYQTLGELRALLSFYNVGVEEVRGERAGVPFRGLVYTVLDSEGEKANVKPIKASVLGKTVGIDELERRMARAGDKIKKDDLAGHCRQRVAEALRGEPDESGLRERLRAANIDLFLRRNKTGRITGVTFIDHEKRCVFNGSRLGKEFSANVFQERFEASQKPVADPHSQRSTSKDTPKRRNHTSFKRSI